MMEASSKREKNIDEMDGPDIDSKNQVERIEARRIRIRRRIEAARREARGENVAEMKSADSEEEKRVSSKQIEDSYQRLVKLKNDGSELVSNIQVACHAREDARRGEEFEIKRQRLEKLEAEAKSAVDKFEEITKKWDLALSKDTPQGLREMLNEQKTACDTMIDEKTNLINDLQQELKAKDDQYVKDLRKQAEDIDLMIERMGEQIKTLLQAYIEELNEIERSFDFERRDLTDGHKRRWDSLMKNRREREIEYMESRQSRVNDFEMQLQALRVQDAEEYNMVKIKLETDVQILEQNLQQMKATYQLNQEKLEYNFQVLKKRDEENTITKSQQKRKITRLQDLLNNLRQKSKKQEKQYSDENQALTDDLKRITEQYKELQKKFRHFQLTDEKKFKDIWLMNEENAKTLVKDVVEEDKIIHEHQLGLPYQEPNLEFLKNVGPLQVAENVKKRSAVQLVEEILSTSSTSTGNSLSQKSGLETQGVAESKHTSSLMDVDTGQKEFSNSKIKDMLELLCDESGFLVESKLLKLLSPLQKDEQSLMKLDAIFNALGIETEDDIHFLASYFFKVVDGNDGDDDDASDENSPAEEDEEEKKEENEDEKEEEHGSENGEEKKSYRAKLEKILISPNEVLGTLRNFVEEHRGQDKTARKGSFRFGTGPVRDNSKDGDYWKMFPAVIDEKKDRLWDGLITGLERYNEILTERANQIQSTEALRQQVVLMFLHLIIILLC